MSNPVKVGIFAVITLIIFIFGFYFLKGSNIFVRKNHLYAVYDRVDGLYVSNLILMNGVKIGRVGPMELKKPSYKAVVELLLDKGIELPANSVAKIVSNNLMGEKVISITRGDLTSMLEDGDTIQTYFKPDLTESLTPVMNHATTLIDSLQTTVKGINYLFDRRNPGSIYVTIATLNKTLADADDMIAGLNDKNGSLQKTLKNVEGFTKNLENNNNKIDKLLANFTDISDSLKQANIKQTVADARTAINGVNELLTGINEGKGTVGKLLKTDELNNQLKTAMDNLNKLLVDIKQRPFRYVTVSLGSSKKREDRFDETKKPKP